MLQDLTWESFKPHLNEAFHITADDARLALELTEVGPIGGEVPENGRQAFSLVFRGPEEPFLEQQIYPLDHEALGRLELFMVPIGQVDGGFLYQVVFG